jgi:hypothetical protein
LLRGWRDCFSRLCVFFRLEDIRRPGNREICRVAVAVAKPTLLSSPRTQLRHLHLIWSSCEMEVVSFQQPDLSFMPGNPYKNSLEGSGSMYSGQQSTRQLTDSEAASVLSMAAFMAFRSLASLAKAPGDFESLRDLLTSIDSLVDKSEARSMKDASIVPERSGISRIEEIESVIGDGHAEASDLKQIEQAPIEDPPMLPMSEDHADSGSMISNVEAPAEEPERHPNCWTRRRMRMQRRIGPAAMTARRKGHLLPHRKGTTIHFPSRPPMLAATPTQTRVSQRRDDLAGRQNEVAVMPDSLAINP